MNDNINHPSHYCYGGVETIDFIKQYKLPYELGNVVKYISRAGKKDTTKAVEDLKKASWYLSDFAKDIDNLNVWSKITRFVLRDIGWDNENSVSYPKISSIEFCRAKKLSERLTTAIVNIVFWVRYSVAGDDVRGYIALEHAKDMLNKEIERLENLNPKSEDDNNGR